MDSSVIAVIATWMTRNADERAVLERVGLVTRLLEVARLEGVGVHEDRAAGLELVDVGPQRGGVHRDEHGRQVARGEDLVIRDLYLERRHPGDRAGGRADLGRVVRHRRQVVAEGGAHVGEAVARELHAVARVPREADDDFRERLRRERLCLCGHTTSFRSTIVGLGPDSISLAGARSRSRWSTRWRRVRLRSRVRAVGQSTGREAPVLRRERESPASRVQSRERGERGQGARARLLELAVGGLGNRDRLDLRLRAAPHRSGSRRTGAAPSRPPRPRRRRRASRPTRAGPRP